MKFTITEIFCEILSGLAVIGVAIGGLDWRGVVTLEHLRDNLAGGLSVDAIALLLAVAYLVGILMDALGMAFDHFFADRIATSPSAATAHRFYRSASAQILTHRDNVWAYYFCYRNLLVLILPGVALWGLALHERYGLDAAGVVVLAAGILAWVLFVAARDLLTLYYSITTSAFAATESPGS